MDTAWAMRRGTVGLGALLAILAAVPVPAARAQTSAAAELAFREGRELMNQGRYREACPKFAESQRLDPAPGTQLNLADCYEKMGRTATAWETFRAAEAAANEAGQRDFASEARKRAEALQPRLSKLTLTAAEPVAGLEVTLDGKPVTALLGSAAPVDPGDHQVAAAAPSRQGWSRTVRVDKQGTTVSVEIPALVAIRQADQAAQPIDDKIAPEPGGRRHRMTPLAWGLAIGAGAALAVGIGFDISAYRDLADCRDSGGCGSQDDIDSIDRRFLVGDILVGAAVAGAGAAVLFYWLGDGEEEARSVDLVATPSSAALVVGGRF